MIRTTIIFIMAILFLFTLAINAQNPEIIKQKLFDVTAANITDISFQDNLCYIKTKDSLLVFTKEGKMKTKKKKNEKYNCFVNEKKYSITNNTVFDELGKKVIVIPQENFKNKTTRFLTFSNNNFYSCVFDTTKMCFSNSISLLRNDSEPLIFAYLVGIPSGLYSDNKYLWYLYNTSEKGSNGMLRKYDIENGDLIYEYELPVINPIGIFIKSNCLYTYSVYTREFFQLALNNFNL